MRLFYCLLKTKAKAIIKANAMTVTDIKPARSNFIINSKVASIIRLTSSCTGGKPHLLVLISYKRNYTQYGNKCQCELPKKQE